jgi:ketosteroid isomerase-like protein
MNVQIVRDLYAAFGRGDLDGVLAACADDIHWRVHAPSVVPFGGRYYGKDGVTTFFDRLLTAMNVTKFEPQTFLEGGDTVVVLGRHEGVAVPTGRTFADEWVQVFVLRDGKVVTFSEFLECGTCEAAYRAG